MTSNVPYPHMQRPPTGFRPQRAMILAAGLGTRMRPLTDDRPKPMINVNGQPLIEHTLDRFTDFGIELAVINLHYRGKMIESHLKERTGPPLHFTHEETLLDTGGGIVQALPHLGNDTFIVANGDALWLNGPQSALGRMAAVWDDSAMDGLLLLHSTVEAFGYDGLGDFTVDPSGLLARRPEVEVSPYLFAGLQFLHPRLFASAPAGAFSINKLWNKAIKAGRLYGMVHDGEWFHIGTPEGLHDAENFLNTTYQKSRRR
jgi:MurNAc alpha-1-phosphate uridylyltransferase